MQRSGMRTCSVKQGYRNRRTATRSFSFCDLTYTPVGVATNDLQVNHVLAQQPTVQVAGDNTSNGLNKGGITCRATYLWLPLQSRPI